MKILIVDDDLDKCEAIKKVIRSVRSDDELIFKHDIFSSKEILCSTHFDLLILDLNLPHDSSGQPDESSGYNLLREIQNIRIYKKPSSIVVVTSHEDLLHKYQEDIENGLFKIISFSFTLSEWQKKLISHLEYIYKSHDDENDTSSSGFVYDVAIITAVEIERQSVSNIISSPQEVYFKGDPTLYTKGFIQSESKKVSVITASQNQMGMAASTALSIKLIRNFKPQYLCMSGIAAGKKGETNFGDIIVATDVWDYGSGKIKSQNEKAGEDNFLFQPSPKYLPLDTVILEALNKDFTEVLDGIKRSWSANKPDSSLRLIKGPMACGSSVVQHEEIITKYIDPHNRNLTGLDMESYGVFYAAASSYLPKPRAIICKSVCDYADSDKNDEYQPYAAYTSSQFLKHLISTSFSYDR